MSSPCGGDPFVNSCRTTTDAGCGDPYAVYGYWRRRFGSDYAYLTCYHYPYTDSRFYAHGYIRNRSSQCNNGCNTNKPL